MPLVLVYLQSHQGDRCKQQPVTLTSQLFPVAQSPTTWYRPRDPVGRPRTRVSSWCKPMVAMVVNPIASDFRGTTNVGGTMTGAQSDMFTAWAA